MRSAPASGAPSTTTPSADLRERGFNPFVVWAFRDNQRARRFYERKGLVIDVPDHDWVLGGVPCPIVRFRIDWPVPDGRMTPADLASRRWFRSKQRSIAAVTEVDRAPIGPGALVVLEATLR